VTHLNPANCSRCWRFYPVFTAVPNARSLNTVGWVRILYGEAHIPFILYVPGGGCGHSDIIVQPQDIFAMILGLADVPVPEGIESQDVLSIACAGRESPRTLAVAGESAASIRAWMAMPDVGR
jgi:hypothetical protein